MTLDRYFPPTTVKPKQDTGIDVEVKCSNPRCGKKLSQKEPIYTLRIKGKENTYCQACAKAILKPQEKVEDASFFGQLDYESWREERG